MICGGPAKDYILESMSGGAAFLDYDNDGWLDIFLVNASTLEDMGAGRFGPPSRLYRNRGNGTFQDVTEKSGAGIRGWGMGVCSADIDGDGWVDIYVTNYGYNVLLMNQCDGSFRINDRGIKTGGWSAGAGFADYDRDGDLDLYVARYVDFDLSEPPALPGGNLLCRFRGRDVYCGPRGLKPLPDVFYRQNEDGIFTNATQAVGTDADPYYGLGVVWGDYNNDGWPDLYVANDSTPNLLFLNRKNGTFSEEGVLAGVAFSADGREQAGMGVDSGDYNNDGWLDLYVTHFSHDYNTLYLNHRNGFFSDVSGTTGHAQATFAYTGWGTGFGDFDNDGWIDIFVANGHVYPQMDDSNTGTSYRQRPQVFLNDRGKKFAEIGEPAGLTKKELGRGVAFGDYDNDGKIDILINNLDGPPTLLHNESTNKNHWVQFRLVGVGKNRNAIGARVEILTSLGTQIREIKSGSSYMSQNDHATHFGLGSSTEIQTVKVRWPDGSLESFTGAKADRLWVLGKGTGKAEPLLFPKKM
ncbi:MAG: CRTAC1 family protein [Acidobacteria bacterium]|nr:CRTAC1 family protein [Acidobacteriota bacterium]MCI0719667.1 CRTAC1 family protein [Acidobacteriota bacterium]